MTTIDNKHHLIGNKNSKSPLLFTLFKNIQDCLTKWQRLGTNFPNIFFISVDIEKIGDDEDILFFQPTPPPQSPTPG